MKATVLAALLACLAPAISAGTKFQAPDLADYQLIDLTHTFDADTVYWPTAPSRFRLERLDFGKTDAGYFYSANSLCTPEHGGTHIDAPLHFGERMRSVAEIPLEQLVAPAVVLDVSAAAATDPEYRLTPQVIRDFEKQFGPIEPGSMVILRTGWSRFWPDPKSYLGDDTPGDASRLRFPGFGAEAARILVEQRKVGVLGIDTASIDFGQSKKFMVHRIAAAANVPGLENLANLERLPPRGAILIALPMKIRGGSGGPTRVIALVPNH